MIFGRVRAVTEILIGRKRLLETLDEIVLRAAGCIVADYRSGRTWRGRNELAVDDPVMLTVESVGENCFEIQV